MEPAHHVMYISSSQVLTSLVMERQGIQTSPPARRGKSLSPVDVAMGPLDDIATLVEL